jgi:hypothetical protein
MDRIKEKYIKYKKKYVKRKEEISNQKELAVGKVETKNVLSEYNILGTGLNSNTGINSINTGINPPNNILSQYNLTPSMSSLYTINKQTMQAQQPMQQPIQQQMQQPIQQQMQQPIQQQVHQPIQQQVHQPIQQQVHQPIQQQIQPNFNEKYSMLNWQQELKKKYETKIEGELKQIKETKRNERREEIEKVIKEREDIESKIEKLKLELEGQIKTELGEKIKVLEKEYLDEYNKLLLAKK